MNKRQFTGKQGEDAAAKYLKKCGYAIIERNYDSPLGEIDIIAATDSTVVFCEVKTRTSAEFGLPKEAVGSVRIRRYRAAATAFLKQRGLLNYSARFDVIEILNGEINHIEGAF